MVIEGLEINSPEYWELRHQRESWPRISGWAVDLLLDLIPDDSSVLEVGCGQGATANYLATARPDIYVKGFDISSTAIKIANENKAKNAEFVVADVFNLNQSFSGQSYSYAYSIQNFEHWKPEYHKAALRQIWSRVAPGGKFFFTGVGRSWPLEINNFGPLPWNGKTIQAPNDLHYNQWSEQDFYDLCMADAIKAKSVRFWRLRGKDRVVAEAEKASSTQTSEIGNEL